LTRRGKRFTGLDALSMGQRESAARWIIEGSAQEKQLVSGDESLPSYTGSCANRHRLREPLRVNCRNADGLIEHVYRDDCGRRHGPPAALSNAALLVGRRVRCRPSIGQVPVK